VPIDEVIDSQKDTALSRVSGEFTDKAMEFQFLEAGWDERRKHLRVAMPILGPAYFLAFIGDYMILGLDPGFWIMMVLRTLLLLGAAVVFALSSDIRRAFALTVSILVTELVIAVSETCRVILEPTNLPEGFLFIILILYFLVPNSLLNTTAICLFMTISSLLGLWLSSTPLPHLLWITIFAILFNLLGFSVVRNRNQLQRREYLFRLQIVKAAQATTEANEKLKASEKRFRDFVTGVPIGFFRASMDGVVIEANPAILDTFGFVSVEEVNKFGLFNLYFYPEERLRLVQAVLQGSVTGYELTFRKASGQLFPVWVHARMVWDEGGHPLFIDGTLEDISERKRLEVQKEEANAALRRSEEQYRLLAENSDDVIFTLDLELHITYISPAWLKLRGVPAEEALNEKLENIITPESLNRVMGEYWRMITEVEKGGNPTVRVELEVYHRDGSRVWVEVSAKTMRDKEQRLTGFIGVARDISVRKETEAALQTSEEKFRQIVNNIPHAVTIMDMNLQLTYASTGVQRMLGYTPEEILGLPLDRVLTPESMMVAGKAFQDAVARDEQGYNPKGLMIFEFTQFHKNGSIVLGETTVTFLRDAKGGTVGILTVSTDITERKLAEARLRESERRLADIINFLPIATMVIDRQGTVTAWNRAMEKLTGVGSEDMVGKGDYEYALPFYGEKRPILIDLVFQSEEELTEKYANIHREGDILSAEAYIPNLGQSGIILVGFASALYDADGEAIGAIESIRDITDIRSVEAQLKEAKDAADRANLSKSVFLANMSHEIRTPMNAILGFAQLMARDTTLSSQAREYLEIINRSGEHLLALINDILEMSKIEAGRATFIPSTFDLHALIQDMELMFIIRADAKGLRLLLEIVDHVPRWVVTDEGKLRQVLINLLGNAVKFTEKGGIALRLRAIPGQAIDVTELQFEVQDTGPGMTEEEMDSLFQMFEQASAGVKIGGTGLGLALSRGFIQLMGGAIEISSNLGQGTLFRFHIPVREGREEEAPLVVASRRVLHLSLGHAEIRVLIADDKETNRKLLSHLLGMVGFVTREATDGEEALRLVSEWRPHVVLMDMAMPVIDGYEATRAIKASPELKDTIIIAVTASAFEEDKRRILAVGADEYLSKPFKDEELFEKIGRLAGADYLYEDQGQAAEETDRSMDLPRLRHSVAALPPAVVSRMREAVESADLEQLNELVMTWAGLHPELARWTREMASRYEYEALIDLFGEETGS
jgi:PAS domain S-box-containing protein